MIPSTRQTTSIPNLAAPATHLLALLFSLATTGILLLLNSFGTINKTTIALIFLLPVGLSASRWGLTPGMVAAFTSFLAFNYYFIEPIHSLTIHNTEDLAILAAFLSVTVVLSQLVGRVKRNLAAATDREQEALLLYEFSNLLAGSQDEHSAAQALLEKIDQALLPVRIEILIENSPEPVLLAKGASLPEDISAKPFVEPLQTTRGLIGEIRLWQPDKSISDSGRRLLKIFASQGVLAIERLRLAETARKTKILEESDRLKSSLLSSVSHELRSPLAAVKASVSSLRSGDVEWESGARTELLITVEEEIDHLNILVGNLLDMSRIEAGALKPQKKPNMLAEIVSAVSGRMRSQLQAVQFITDVPDDLPLVNVDFIQIQQVFTNLLVNSLKYSPTGSTIKITAKQKDAHFLLVTCTNQSTSVPEPDLDRIFDKFYRINSSDQVTGSGLGLSICKGIIEAHGGIIWAENLPQGLAFNFTLPLS
jgi:two-component system, OmpR family, sensor histidine kinase KdpD